MADHGDVLEDHRAAVDPALAHRVVPDRSARGPAGSRGRRRRPPADQQQPLAADPEHGGRGVGGVEGAAARGRDPDDLAGALVEAEKALAAPRLFAPGRSQAAQDHQVVEDQRRSGPAPVGGDEAELLGEGAFPADAAVLGVESGQAAADSEREDGSGLGVDGRGGPSHPPRRRVRVVEVAALFPEERAGAGVEGHQPFLPGRADTEPVLQEETISEDHRGRTAAVGNLEEEIFAGGRPGFREPGLGRAAVAGRPPPFRPIRRRCGSRGRHRDGEKGGRNPANAQSGIHGGGGFYKRARRTDGRGRPRKSAPAGSRHNTRQPSVRVLAAAIPAVPALCGRGAVCCRRGPGGEAGFGGGRRIAGRR